MTDSEQDADSSTDESTAETATGTDDETATESTTMDDTAESKTVSKLDEEYQRSPPRRSQRPGPQSRTETLTKERMVNYLFWAGFGLLAFLSAVALFGFYTATRRVINIWITSQYEPIFLAVFNLGVLLACLVGLSLLVRYIDTPEANESAQDS